MFSDEGLVLKDQKEGDVDLRKVLEIIVHKLVSLIYHSEVYEDNIEIAFRIGMPPWIALWFLRRRDYTWFAEIPCLSGTRTRSQAAQNP